MFNIAGIVAYLEWAAPAREWVCEECKDPVPAGELCPGCQRNRVILLAESDAQKLLEWLRCQTTTDFLQAAMNSAEAAYLKAGREQCHKYFMDGMKEVMDIIDAALTQRGRVVANQQLTEVAPHADDSTGG